VSLFAANAMGPRLGGRDLYALVFGLFLGLALLKFGNPVILDHKITAPTSLTDAWSSPWPVRWGNWLLALLALAGVWLAVRSKLRWRCGRWPWVLSMFWFGWQLVSATQTVDRALTATTLWHFAACLACYSLGAVVLCYERGLRWLLVGLLAAFAFCLVRAANQRLFEFPQDRQLLLEGERSGWTNFPPQVVQQMKYEGVIITTNGVAVVNPAILVKLTKGRVHGTLVYPNALAGAILLLWPLATVIAFTSTRAFRTFTRWIAIVLTLALGGAGLFWTGSKSGWLIALALCVVWVFRLRWPKRWKGTVLATIVMGGLAVFAVRFHGYFASGAASVSARFDYWRAAVQTTCEHPWLGTGPGTFQRPYARLKAPDAEMARLTHNDYLEQFCDSGIIGGISFAVWIGFVLVAIGRQVWHVQDPLPFTVFLGLLGWFVQCLSEFGLYVPALAWIAFTLLGWLCGFTLNRFDSKPKSY
jgi:general stress protein CsbA